MSTSFNIGAQDFGIYRFLLGNEMSAAEHVELDRLEESGGEPPVCWVWGWFDGYLSGVGASLIDGFNSEEGCIRLLRNRRSIHSISRSSDAQNPRFFIKYIRNYAEVGPGLHSLPDNGFHLDDTERFTYIWKGDKWMISSRYHADDVLRRALITEDAVSPHLLVPKLVPLADALETL